MSVVDRLWGSAPFWRGTAAVLATTALALLVAALIGREPPDFDAQPVLAVLRDTTQHPLWAIRLAPGAHQLAVDSLAPPSPPAGKVYQLWLAGPGAAPQPLGLLPYSGRKIIAEIPADIRLLAGGGELRVTLEPAVKTLIGAPSGPVLFRAKFGGAV